MYIDPVFLRSNRASPDRRSGAGVASVILTIEGFR